MTLGEYLDVARERWRFVLAGLILGLLAAIALTMFIPRQYSASVTMILSVTAVPSATPDGADAIAQRVQSEDVSAQRMRTYVELLRSKRLAGDVVDSLDLNISPDILASRITATSAPETVLLTATVASDSADGAIEIANVLAAEFIKNVAELEQPSNPAWAPLLEAKVFEPAAPPAEMITPRPVLYVLVGAALGLLAGFAAALLRNWLDTSLKRRSQLLDILGAPVLGVIGRDPKIVNSPLGIYGDPQAAVFRRIRANLHLADVDRAHKVVLITSPSSDEGKTMVLCNLANAVADVGSNALVIEADLRQRKVASAFGINRTAGLTNVLAGGARVERVVVRWREGLDVVPSGLLPPNPRQLLGSPKMVALLADARAQYDVVFLGAPPLMPIADTLPLATLADGVVLVVRHGTALQDLHSAREALGAMSLPLLGTVMTMAPGRQARRDRRDGPRDSALREPPGPDPEDLRAAGAPLPGAPSSHQNAFRARHRGLSAAPTADSAVSSHGGSDPDRDRNQLEAESEAVTPERGQPAGHG